MKYLKSSFTDVKERFDRKGFLCGKDLGILVNDNNITFWRSTLTWTLGEHYPDQYKYYILIFDLGKSIWASLIVKEESEKVGLKLNIQKTKIMASSPITSWQIDGETVSDFILGAPKSLQMVTAAMKLKEAYSLEEKL